VLQDQLIDNYTTNNGGIQCNSWSNFITPAIKAQSSSDDFYVDIEETKIDRGLSFLNAYSKKSNHIMGCYTKKVTIELKQ
jgi:hypothetical protein